MLRRWVHRFVARRVMPGDLVIATLFGGEFDRWTWLDRYNERHVERWGSKTPIAEPWWEARTVTAFVLWLCDWRTTYTLVRWWWRHGHPLVKVPEADAEAERAWFR